MEMKDATRFFYRLLIEGGMTEHWAQILNLIINLVVLCIVSYIVNKIFHYLSDRFFHRLTRKTKTEFDDFLYKNKTIANFTHLLTVILMRWALPEILADFSYLKKEVGIALNIAIIIFIIILFRSIMRTFKDYLNTLDNFKDKPIESYIQVFMIFAWLIGLVIIFSLLTGQSIIDFLTALGAVSAVILLVFKDTIMGFVASIQVSVNDTVRIGDWITMEKYSADGDVVEINLSSVKVRNFDYTITSIPTYFLISDSFKNWRGMSVSGGRRIKRSLLIKSASVHFVDEDEIESFKKIQRVKDYLSERQQDIQKFNQKSEADKELALNGRNLTNLGVFRRYIDIYLENHPQLNQEMMVMSRQLQPTAQGIPLEIYAFSQDKVWKNYERVMADIFDHLLSAIPYFNLECYEYPSGKDIQNSFRPEKPKDN
jgi:miniconductance mechanosensitive channel